MKRVLIEDKTAQFYLIAAIIISVIVIGFLAMSNYLKKTEAINLEYKADELKIESEKVLDYGLHQAYGESSIQSLMENFAKYYINYTEKDKDSYFLFGTSS